MFRTLTLLRRRADLTHDQFVERYETGHARLGERRLRGSATRYVRRYLRPAPYPGGGEPPGGEHDVAMEIWLPDRATWEATMARLADPATRVFVVEERESVL